MLTAKSPVGICLKAVPKAAGCLGAIWKDLGKGRFNSNEAVLNHLKEQLPVCILQSL